MQILSSRLGIAACGVQILVAQNGGHLGQLRAGIEQALTAGVAEHVWGQFVQ